MNTALVTGAARNIGKGIAAKLLEAGYRCVLVDSDAETLKKTKEELSKKSHECTEYVADMSQMDQVQRLYQWLKDESFGVDTLINNVGIGSRLTVLDFDLDKMSKTFRTNMDGPFLLTSLLAKDMSETSPSNIVFTSSVHGQIIRTDPFYSASKAAIEMYVKEAAVELASHGIRVNAVAPGPVVEEGGSTEYVPLGKNQQPVDIAEAVLFLISDKARYITGHTLTVDGGFSLAHTHHWKKQGKL